MAGLRFASRFAGALRVGVRGVLRISACGVAGAGFGLAGCAAPPTDAGRTPDNLMIDVTVLCGAGVADHPEADRRPGRLVLFPDGALHYADEHDAGFRPGPDWLPGPTRSIDPGTMGDVWTLVERLGLLDRDTTLPPIDLDQVETPPGTITYVVEVTARRRSRVRIDHVPDEPGARSASADLVRRLAALAWATDQPESGLVTAPPRYDFGPDPYARYRRP